MINFLAELSKTFNIIIQPTPSVKYTKNYNIYELDIRKTPKQSYWTDWGGWYDNFVGTDIVLYYSDFLTKIFIESDFLSDQFNYVYMIANGIVYIKIPKHPWLYPNYSTESRVVFPFLSSALDPDNPSNTVINDTQGSVKLEIPSVNVKLSDNFAGVSLNQGFSLSLSNNDGYFDDENEWNIFNTPVILKKSIKKVSVYNDFKEIRSGRVDNTTSNFEQLQVSVSDKIKSLNEPMCKVILEENYHSITIDKSLIGKNIPVVYGDKKVKLLKLNPTMYLASEKLTSVKSAYNKSGAVVPATSYTPNYATGVITTINSSIDLDTALITGYVDNRIGSIIKDIMMRKSRIPYGPTNWNIKEVDKYNTVSPSINIEITSGDVKKAIDDILKSDMAYFIQQLDGIFTIRKYGLDYATHRIPSWTLTKKPEKDYSKAQENYFSSCIINYGYTDKDAFKSYLYNERENEAEDTYKKLVQKTFDTDLYDENEVKAFAKLLGKRYITLKQAVKLSLGTDTSDMNLLDTVRLDLNINERKFSNADEFIIKEINPAQDTLILEEYK